MSDVPLLSLMLLLPLILNDRNDDEKYDGRDFSPYWLADQQGVREGTVDEDEQQYILHVLRHDLHLEGPLSNTLILAAQKTMATTIPLGTGIDYYCLARELAISIERTQPPSDSRVIIFNHILARLHIEPTAHLYSMFDYLQRSGEMLPLTMTAVDALYHRIVSIERNVESYCVQNRHPVQTPHLDQLVSICNLVDDRHCSICQDEISKGVPMYQLSPCGCCFHSDGASCLQQDHTIVTWLQTHRTCPNCQQEVHLAAMSAIVNDDGKNIHS